MSKPYEAMPVIDDGAIQELTTRAVSEVYPSASALSEELRSGRQLTAYMGIDPTAPDMHVGHQSQLLKLKRFQDLGHNTILLIGDFTAMIGDPSDKSAARVKLTREEVMENAEGYKQQASKILDFDRSGNPTQLCYNSDWLGRMDFGDVLELASEFTVQQMLERQTFQKRMRDGKPVGLHEFLYPMMQGWDSVKMGVDVEVGGSDQIFNMLVGSKLVGRHLNKQKFVIAGELLADPSGKKIGKTEGNMITLNDVPTDMYHKIMQWGDAITPHALELCTTMPMEDIVEIDRKMQSGELAGLAAKMLLAERIVTDLHSPDAAHAAAIEYKNLTAKGSEIDVDLLAEYGTVPGQSIVDMLVGAGLAPSRSAARRLVQGHGVRINDITVGEEWTMPTGVQAAVLQVGKKKRDNFRRLSIEE